MFDWSLAGVGMNFPNSKVKDQVDVRVNVIGRDPKNLDELWCHRAADERGEVDPMGFELINAKDEYFEDHQTKTGLYIEIYV